MPEQAVELAQDVTDSFIRDADSDGLLGLGFSAINTVRPQRQRTFFDNVAPTLAQPVFTANLRHATVGAYEFGAIDASQFRGPLTFIPVDPSRGFWQFDTPGFAVGDEPMQSSRPAGAGAGQSAPSSATAIADTGTSLLLLDDSVAAAYWSRVPGARRDRALDAFVFPCDAPLPDFHLALGSAGNYTATIAGPLMNFSPARGQPGNCFGGIQSNAGQQVQILGDLLFKSQFVAFDGAKLQIGFALHA